MKSSNEAKIRPGCPIVCKKGSDSRRFPARAAGVSRRETLVSRRACEKLRHLGCETEHAGAIGGFSEAAASVGRWLYRSEPELLTIWEGKTQFSKRRTIAGLRPLPHLSEVAHEVVQRLGPAHSTFCAGGSPQESPHYGGKASSWSKPATSAAEAHMFSSAVTYSSSERTSVCWASNNRKKSNSPCS